MYCASCGYGNVEDARFCSQCGSRLDGPGEAASYRPLDIRQGERPQGSIPTRDLGGLISETFGVYSRNFWQFVLIAFIASIPDLAAAFMPWVLSLIFTLLGLVLAFLAGPAIMRAVIQQYVGDRRIDVRECWYRALGRAIALFVALILAGLALVVSLILFIVLIGIPIFFYLLASWFFAPQAIMIEQKGPIAALGRSRALVRGSWWRVFGIGIVFVVLTLLLSGAGGASGAVVGLANSTLGSIVGTVTATLLFPIVPISATLVYIDLRVRKEGYSLEAMAAEISPAPSGVSTL